MNTKEQIRKFLSRRFKTEDLDDTEDIFAGGYVDSLFALQLLAWLEHEFSIIVENTDLRIENFNSVQAIGAFIERKAARNTIA